MSTLKSMFDSDAVLNKLQEAGFETADDLREYLDGHEDDVEGRLTELDEFDALVAGLLSDKIGADFFEDTGDDAADETTDYESLKLVVTEAIEEREVGIIEAGDLDVSEDDIQALRRGIADTIADGDFPGPLSIETEDATHWIVTKSDKGFARSYIDPDGNIEIDSLDPDFRAYEIETTARKLDISDGELGQLETAGLVHFDSIGAPGFSEQGATNDICLVPVDLDDDEIQAVLDEAEPEVDPSEWTKTVFGELTKSEFNTTRLDGLENGIRLKVERIGAIDIEVVEGPEIKATTVEDGDVIAETGDGDGDISHSYKPTYVAESVIQAAESGDYGRDWRDLVPNSVSGEVLTVTDNGSPVPVEDLEVTEEENGVWIEVDGVDEHFVVRENDDGRGECVVVSEDYTEDRVIGDGHSVTASSAINRWMNNSRATELVEDLQDADGFEVTDIDDNPPISFQVDVLDGVHFMVKDTIADGLTVTGHDPQEDSGQKGPVVAIQGQPDNVFFELTEWIRETSSDDSEDDTVEPPLSRKGQFPERMENVLEGVDDALDETVTVVSESMRNLRIECDIEDGPALVIRGNSESKAYATVDGRKVCEPADSPGVVVDAILDSLEDDEPEDDLETSDAEDDGGETDEDMVLNTPVDVLVEEYDVGDRYVSLLEFGGYDTMGAAIEFLEEKGREGLDEAPGIGDTGVEQVVDGVREWCDDNGVEFRLYRPAQDTHDLPDLSDLPDPANVEIGETVEFKTGKFIRAVRKRRTDYTMRDLAETLDISESFLGEIERGTNMASIEKYDAIIDALPFEEDEREAFLDAVEREKAIRRAAGGHEVAVKLSDVDRRIVRRVQDLDEADKRDVLSMIEDRLED
ncbi:MAG: helix-turn-helix domain-containing protein [Bradymonadaceae bacterium]